MSQQRAEIVRWFSISAASCIDFHYEASFSALLLSWDRGVVNCRASEGRKDWIKAHKGQCMMKGWILADDGLAIIIEFLCCAMKKIPTMGILLKAFKNHFLIVGL